MAQHRPLVVAHRGASAAARENTLEAFRLAGDLGADWVELDVRHSADGAMVLHHDAELPDGRRVPEVVAADLPDHVPTLAEALAVCWAADLGVNVEIKALPGEPGHEGVRQLTDDVVALVLGGRAGAGADADGVLVTSFDPRTIDRVHDATDGAVATGLLVFDASDRDAVVARAAEHGHGAINPWDAVTDQPLVDAAHAAGLAVNVWTVDDPDRLAQLVAMGVDGLITNVPDVARRVVDATG